MDIVKLAEDEGLNGSINIGDVPLDAQALRELSSSTGLVESKTLFNNGNLLNESIILKTQSGIIYNGPAHNHDSGVWMTGAEHTEKSVNLSHEIVPDHRIEDLRATEALRGISSLSFKRRDLDKIKNSLMKRYVKKNRNLLKEIPESSYFSNILLSTDHFGNSLFSFSVNTGGSTEGLFSDRCLFPNLIRQIPGDINNLFKIKKIDLLRRRVKEQSKNLNLYFQDDDEYQRGNFRNNNSRMFKNQLTPWDKNNSDETVICRTDGDTDVASMKSGAVDSLNLNKIRRVLDNVPDVTFFTGVDTDIKYKGVGNYQYGVEIEVEDGTVRFLTNVLTDLISSKSLLDSYYRLLTSPRPCCSASTKISDLKGLAHVEYYNANSGSMVSAIVNIESYYKLLTGNSLESLLSVSSSASGILFGMLKPETGSIEGVNVIIDFLNQLITIVSSSLDISSTALASYEKNLNQNENSGTRLHKNQSTKTFKIKHYFTNDVSSALEFLQPGVEYVMTNERQQYNSDYIIEKNRQEHSGRFETNKTAGLNIISTDDYGKRATDEVKRDFDRSENKLTMAEVSGKTIAKNVSVDETKYTYLSPKVITTVGGSGDESFVFDFSKTIETKDLMKSAVNILNSKFSRGIKNTPKKAEVVVKNRDDELQSKLELVEMIDGLNNFLNNHSNCSISRASNTNNYKRAPWRSNASAASAETANLLFSKIVSKNSDMEIANPKLSDQEEEGKATFATNTTTSIGPSDLKTGNHSFNIFGNIALKEFKSQKAKKDVPVGIKNYDLKHNNNILSKTKEQMLKDNPLTGEAAFDKIVKKMPNQIKSLFFHSQSSSKNNFEASGNSSGRYIKKQSTSKISESFFKPESKDPMLNSDTFFDFYNKYLNLVCIKVLTGYKVIGGKYCMNSPIWSDMDQKLFLRIGSSNSEFICKVEPYENDLLGTGQIKKMNLPIYNRYFIVKSSGNATVGKKSSVASMSFIKNKSLEKVISYDRKTNSMQARAVNRDPVNFPRRSGITERRANPVNSTRTASAMVTSTPRTRNPSRRRGY